MCSVLPPPRAGAPRRARSCGAAVEAATLPPLVEPHLPATGQRAASLGPAAGRAAKRRATAAPCGARNSSLLEEHLPPIGVGMPQVSSAPPQQNSSASVQPAPRGGVARNGRPPSAERGTAIGKSSASAMHTQSAARATATGKSSAPTGHPQARQLPANAKRPAGGPPPPAPGTGRPPSSSSGGLPGREVTGAAAKAPASQRTAARHTAPQSASQTGAATGARKKEEDGFNGKTRVHSALLTGSSRAANFPERREQIMPERRAAAVEQELKQPPAESSTACGDKARGAGDNILNEARDFMSDDLRRVIEEETVTYSWRRKSDAGKKQDDVKKGACSQSDLTEQPRQKTDSLPTQSTADSAMPGGAPLDTAAAEETPARPASNGGSPNRPPSNIEGRPASNAGSPNRPPSIGKGASKAQPKSKSSQNTKSALGKPPRPSVTSSDLVLAKPGVGKAAPASAGSQGTSAGSRPSTAARVDISQAAHARAERIASCSKAFDFGAQLITYDGSAPFLKGGFLSSACQGPVCQWAHGDMSGEFACLYVDDWAQGDVLWQEVPAGVLVQELGVIAGMLADPSLQRSFTAELHGNVFSLLPADVAKSAAQAIIDAVHPEDGSILVSAVENELSMLEACATGQGSAAKLRAAVQRELLRFFWAGTAPAAADVRATDIWLLGELAQSPQSVAESARAAGVERLQRENQLLDAYLIRLLRLKRALSVLIDKWEKVDYYAVLGVAPTCSDKELKNAYRKACLRLHPDKGGDKTQFQQLQDAYARILEERAKQAPSAKQAPPASQPPAPSKASGGNSTSASASAPRKADCGPILALEGGGLEAGSCSQRTGAIPEAAAEVVAALQHMLSQVEVVENCMKQAERADSLVQQLRQKKSENGGDAVEALRGAQEAGETLLNMSEEVGSMGPALSEATMEVSECSLVLAARFAAVPAALLLTDVALSCTFEASRMQHAAQQLLEVRSDTITTLQTLKTNLQMAKIIGTVDAETLKLSLGLVGKAAKRLIASLRQVACAVADAGQRGRQCSSHAKSIAAFAEGRSEKEEAFANDDFGPQAALPAPDGADWPASESTDQGPPSANEEPRSSPSAAKPPQQQEGVDANSTKPQRANAMLESRLQNDKLLRQLNADLLDLQRRARGHLAKSGAALLDNIPNDARSQALQLVAEILVTAAEQVKAEFAATVNDKSHVSDLEACMARHFDFVEACGCGLAMTTDLRTQLLRLGALLDSQAVICALEKGVKPLLAVHFNALSEDKRAPLLATLDRRFDLLCSSVVAVRMV